MQIERGLSVLGDNVSSSEQVGPRSISAWEIAAPLIRRLSNDEAEILRQMILHNANGSDCLPSGEAHVAQCEEWARLCEALHDNSRRRSILLVRLGLLDRQELCR